MIAETKTNKTKKLLISQITQGKYTAGERFPSGRQLAASMDISYVISNNILRELESEGYLRRIPGVGTFVCKPRPVREHANEYRIGYLVDVNVSIFGRFFTTILNHIPSGGSYCNVPLRMLPGLDTISREEHAQWLEEVFQKHWDSLIVYGDRHFPFRELAKYESDAGQINFIFFADTELPFEHANRILVDAEKIGHLVGTHFLRKGRKKIAVFSLRNLDEIYRRRIGVTIQHHGIQILNGLEQAYQEYNNDFYSLVHIHPYHQRMDTESACELIEKGFRSFFVMQDHWALPVYEAAAKLRLEIGRDVEVLGMNNVVNADFMKPSLSSISLNEVGIGEILSEAIQKKWIGKTVHVAPEIIYRQSSLAGE